MLLALMLQVELLGHDDPDVREAATAALSAKGAAVEAEVRRAAASDDPEVSIRAQRLLRRLSRLRAGRILYQERITEAPHPQWLSVSAAGGDSRLELDEAYDFAVSLDGLSRAALVDHARIVVTTPASEPRAYPLPDEGTGVETLSWCPTGRRLLRSLETCTQAMDVIRTIEVFDPHSAANEPVVSFSGHSPSWSPDGRRMAFIDKEIIDRLNVGSLEDGSFTTLIETGHMTCPPVWSRDGSRLFLLRKNRDMFAVNANGGGSSCLMSVERPRWLEGSWGILATGEVLLSVCGSESKSNVALLVAIDPDSTKVRVLGEFGHTGMKTGAVCPDGKFVAVVHENRLYVIDADGDNAQVVAEDVAEGSRAAWFVPR